MVRFKGIADLVAASEQLQSRGVAHRLLLAGTPDTTNPAVISEAELAEWDRQPQIEWRGHVADVRSLWAEAHVAALASHGGEGLPKTLLEAAACGRPVVATDVPGTREVVQHDRTGLLVPPRRPDLLAAALERLVLDAEERRRFGAAGRALVERELSLRSVAEHTLSLYRRLLTAS
jgi:glycosyltransferase involved in cell wall biosynthesis